MVQLQMNALFKHYSDSFVQNSGLHFIGIITNSFFINSKDKLFIKQICALQFYFVVPTLDVLYFGQQICAFSHPSISIHMYVHMYIPQVCVYFLGDSSDRLNSQGLCAMSTVGALEIIYRPRSCASSRFIELIL